MSHLHGVVPCSVLSAKSNGSGKREGVLHSGYRVPGTGKDTGKRETKTHCLFPRFVLSYSRNNLFSASYYSVFGITVGAPAARALIYTVRKQTQVLRNSGGLFVSRPRRHLLSRLGNILKSELELTIAAQRTAPPTQRLDHACRIRGDAVPRRSRIAEIWRTGERFPVPTFAGTLRAVATARPMPA